MTGCCLFVRVLQHGRLSFYFLAEGVQSARAYDAHAQGANAADLSDENLCPRPSAGEVSLLVLCIYAEESEEDPRRDPLLQPSKQQLHFHVWP